MEDKVEKKENVQEKPLDKMTVKELREIAMEIPDITGVHGMKKDELLSVVKKTRGITDEEPVKKKKVKKTSSGPMSIKEMKQKIVQLRAEREEIRKTGDRKKLDALRRLINRLKKQTRKSASA